MGTLILVYHFFDSVFFVLVGISQISIRYMRSRGCDTRHGVARFSSSGGKMP